MATSDPGAARSSWRAWLVGSLVGLIVFLTPLAILSTLADNPPEIRLTPTGQRFSALVVSEDRSILLINSDRPDEATSALGRLRRPWEPQPEIIIAPATDDAAPGIHQAVQLLEPRQVIVAGLPGADPTWSHLERVCRERGIDLVFLPDYMRIDAGVISLFILAPGNQPDGASEIVISRNGLQIAVGMSQKSARTPAQITVVSGDAPSDSSTGSVVVHGSWAEQNSSSGSLVLARNQEVVTVLLDEGRMRVKGGHIRDRAPEANTGR